MSIYCMPLDDVVGKRPVKSANMAVVARMSLVCAVYDRCPGFVGSVVLEGGSSSVSVSSWAQGSCAGAVVESIPWRVWSRWPCAVAVLCGGCLLSSAAVKRGKVVRYWFWRARRSVDMVGLPRAA